MERRRIGIDLDGVIIDHRENKRNLAAEFGVNLENWQCDTNIVRQFMSPTVYSQAQEILYRDLTLSAPPIPGALEAIRSLDADIYIVSARKPTSIRFAQDWLGRHRVYDVIPADRIFFCGLGDDKRSYCLRYRLEAFIDDKLSILKNLPETTSRMLFDIDGNAYRLGDLGGVKPVRRWQDVLHVLKG